MLHRVLCGGSEVKCGVCGCSVRVVCSVSALCECAWECGVCECECVCLVYVLFLFVCVCVCVFYFQHCSILEEMHVQPFVWISGHKNE